MNNLWHLCSSVASVESPSQYDSYVAVIVSNKVHLFGRDGSTLTGLGSVDPGSVVSVHISPDGEYMAVVISAQDMPVYKRMGNRYELLTTLPFSSTTTQPSNVAWSPDGQYIIYSRRYNTPTVYKRTGDTFTEVTSGITFISHTCSYSPLGNYIAFGYNIAPRFSIYKQSGDTFTSLGAPVGTPNSTVISSDWTADEKYLAVVFNVNSANSIRVFERTGDQFNILPTLPGVTSRSDSLAWSPDGSILAVGKSTTLDLFHRSGNTFTKLTSPPAILEQFRHLCWSNDNLLFASADASSGSKLYVYELIDDTLELLTSYDLPGTVPNRDQRGISIWPWSTT